MGNLDLKFHFAVFMRRLPYFLVIAMFLSAIGMTVAWILPPVYRSQASMLVEPQQIPGELAESTVPINPFEQIQIIEQRIMTRSNLLALAERIGLYEGLPELGAGAIVSDIRDRIEFIGFTPDETRRPDEPGATIIGVAFNAQSGPLAVKGANELISLILEENVRLRTGRAGDTLEFFESETARLSEAIERQAERIAAFKTENFEALPDSLATRRAQQLREQERLLALEREEAGLRNDRASAVWVFERTGRANARLALSREEEELQALNSRLIQQRAIYNASSPTIRVLEQRIAALEGLVDSQRASRAVPGADGEAAAPLSELEVELAPIDARLEFIAEEKALIEETLAELDATIQSTPTNEMNLANLERGLADLQRDYGDAVGARGQAQVGERIEVLSKGERFSLIEAPTEPNNPASPNRVLIAGAGVVGGIGAGLGFVLLMELLNRSIRRPVDLNTRLGIEPLASVPYIRTRSEIRWKRSVIVLVFLVVIVVIPAGLYALHTFYQPLDLLLGDVLGLSGF